MSLTKIIKIQRHLSSYSLKCPGSFLWDTVSIWRNTSAFAYVGPRLFNKYMTQVITRLPTSDGAPLNAGIWVFVQRARPPLIVSARRRPRLIDDHQNNCHHDGRECRRHAQLWSTGPLHTHLHQQQVHWYSSQRSHRSCFLASNAKNIDRWHVLVCQSTVGAHKVYFLWRIRAPPYTWFPDATHRVHIPNGISVCSAVLAQLTILWLICHARDVTLARILLSSSSSFICSIIPQYVHLHEYDFRRAGQQGPIRTLTAALKRYGLTMPSSLLQ